MEPPCPTLTCVDVSIPANKYSINHLNLLVQVDTKSGTNATKLNVPQRMQCSNQSTKCKKSWSHWATTGNFDFAVCTIVCRVQIHGHTVNMIFAECAQENTRQNQSTRQSYGLPCAFFSTRQRNTLPCVFLWHTAKLNFVVCFILAHGKVIKKICLLTSKFFLHFTYNMWYSMLKFDTFLYLFVIFN